MSRLVFFPSDPIIEYIEKGRTYDFLDEYYNPGNFFDEVYCLSPWGEKKEEKIGNITYIKAAPTDFARIIRKIKPDVIRGYGGYCCSDWVSINKVKGIPTVVSVHDTNPELIHESLKYADGIICMSQAVKDAVLENVHGVTSDIWVMPNRIDTELFKYTYNQEYFENLDKLFPGGKHILHVGRKCEQKNQDTLIKSMKYLDEEVVAIFVGHGNTEYYKKLAQSEGVLDRCYFLDRVSNDEMPLWYSWCDCMCTPSRWEGFGYVFIEATACESIVVTSNLGPMNEYLTNGKDAILVDEYENPQKIAASIKYALENNDEIKEIRKNAREVGLRFSKEVIDEQEISIYKTMLECEPNNLNYKQLRKQISKDIFFEKMHRYVKKHRCVKKIVSLIRH